MYEISETWKQGPRVKIGSLPKGKQCLDIQGRALTIDHHYKHSATIGRINHEGEELTVSYASNAEVVAL